MGKIFPLMSVTIHSYLASTGISKEGKFILLLLYHSFAFLAKSIHLVSYSNSHIQPSELPY